MCGIRAFGGTGQSTTGDLNAVFGWADVPRRLIELKDNVGLGAVGLGDRQTLAALRGDGEAVAIASWHSAGNSSGQDARVARGWGKPDRYWCVASSGAASDQAACRGGQDTEMAQPLDPDRSAAQVAGSATPSAVRPLSI